MLLFLELFLFIISSPYEVSASTYQFKNMIIFLIHLQESPNYLHIMLPSWPLKLMEIKGILGVGQIFLNRIEGYSSSILPQIRLITKFMVTKYVKIWKVG